MGGAFGMTWRETIPGFSRLACSAWCRQAGRQASSTASAGSPAATCSRLPRGRSGTAGWHSLSDAPAPLARHRPACRDFIPKFAAGPAGMMLARTTEPYPAPISRCPLYRCTNTSDGLYATGPRLLSDRGCAAALQDHCGTRRRLAGHLAGARLLDRGDYDGSTVAPFCLALGTHTPGLCNCNLGHSILPTPGSGRHYQI